jgi:tripartite-type tricarboxylate transporter receptor subunit TctC
MDMLIRRAALAALPGLLALARPALAQGTFPDRPLRLVVPFPAGGATDALARVIAQAMTPALGQSVAVENRAGAAGAIGAEAVARAAPDGHSFLMSTSSTHAVLPAVQPRMPYDAEKDFASIGLVATATNILIASPKLPANNVAELIALAKSRPGTLNFASSGTGTVTHLIGEMFRMRAGIRVEHVPFRGGVQSVPGLVDGSIQYLFDSVVWSLPLIREGRIKGLAVTASRRSALAPDMPTVAESGLPGFEGDTWFGLSAPAGTPPAALAKLSGALQSALRAPGTAEALARFGAEPAADASPGAFDALIAADKAKWGAVVREAGVKVE